ncbi:MAG: 50S ribosomal protein L17 [Pseudomonadota bacterium]
MRHAKAGVKLGRTTSHKIAMFRNMVTSLFIHGQIKTTDVKAKELKRWADQMVTLAKRGDLHARRQAMSVIRDKNVVHKLFEEAPGRYGAISGGYTRVVKLGYRKGDAALLSLVELVGAEEEIKEKKAGWLGRKKVKEAAAPAGAPKTGAAEPEVQAAEPEPAQEAEIPPDFLAEEAQEEKPEE